MVMTNPSLDAGPAQQFKSLRLRIPVIEFADSTTDELVEPYPANGRQWHKTSRIALLFSAIFAVATIALSLAAYGRMKSSERQLQAGQYNNQKAIQAAAQRTQALKAPSFKQYLDKNPQFFELLAPALLNCSQWSIHREALVTISYALLEDKDPLDTLTTLVKGMAAAKYQRIDQKDAGNNQHIITYGPQ